jgi:hypothetical protein
MLAYHIDLKRPMWRPDYLLAMAARLRAWGYDTLFIEIEDKFRFARHPLLRHPEAPSHREWRDLVARCRRIGLDAIPLFQTLGHAESVVGKPEYAHLRECIENTAQYDPTSPAAQAFLRQVLDELIDVMRPREFIHLGGDETWALGRSEKCRPIVEKEGVGGLYLRHMLPLFEHVRARGLRPMIWADIVLSHPRIMPRIPRDVVMVDWDYRTDAARPSSIYIWGAGPDGRRNARVTWADYPRCATPQFRKYLGKHAVDRRTRRDGTFRLFYCTDALRAAGFDVITAPANRCAGDMTGVSHQSLHIANSFFGAQKGLGGLGALVTSWAVRHNHPEVTLPATFAASLGARPGAAFDPNSILGEFCRAFHGVEMPEFAPAVRQAEAQFPLGQAAVLEPACRRARAGLPALAEHADKMAEQCGSRAKAVDRIRALITGYDAARRTFSALRKRARANAAVFDYWIEGVAFNALLARLLLAQLRRRLLAERAPLAARLRACRARTRRLFARTYLPHGVRAESEMRYDFIAASLRLPAAGQGARP